MAPTSNGPRKPAPAPSSEVITIRPAPRWRRIDWQEVRQYRELLYFLTLRDVQVRYKQTAIGVVWAILQPLLAMLVFTLFFGRFGNIPSDGAPYALFALAALVPWSFFSGGLTHIANSVVDNAQLVTKVYFPRVIVPLASMLSRLVDFALAFLVLITALLLSDISLSVRILVLPLFVLLAIVTALGVGIWLSALNVQFRDVRLIVPFLSQVWLFVTPVIYPSSMLPASWHGPYALNPMVGVVEGFRWCLLGTGAAPGVMVIVSTLAALLVLISGVYYFRHMERRFADIV